MLSLLNLLWSRTSILAVSLVLTALALAPVRTLADDEMALDVGHRRGGGEGDPLDTNDNPIGDDPTDNPHDTAGKSGRSIFGGDFWSARILLVPEYNGVGVTFKVIFISDASQYLEAWDAK